jgi:putative PIG3 family NAD(P)H quinone oxidoreductase
MPITARAVRIRGAGGTEVLEFGEISVRDPGPSEIALDVKAVGLNRADVLQRRGFYPAPPGVVPDVPGLEYAGVVRAVGEGVRDFAPGDEVMGIVAGGAMATGLVVHAREAIPIPDGMPMTEAAAIPEVFFTAYDALFHQANMGPGQFVLLHAVGSGLGTAALQLVHVVGGRTIGTSRTESKLERCRALGLEHAIEVKDGHFADAVDRITGGRLADTIVDVVGAAYLGENIRAIASKGCLVVLGLMGGARGELPLGELLRKRARLVGSVLRSRPLEEKAALAQAFRGAILPHFVSGHIAPVIDVVLKMDEIREAHRRMESNESFGKIVLSWD